MSADLDPPVTMTTLRRDVTLAADTSALRIRVVHSPDPDYHGAEFVLDGRELVFGRSSDASERVRDQRMSRRHVALSAGSSGYLVEDLDTTNGTYLDGAPVTGRRPLDGVVLSAGDTLMVVDREPARDHLPAAPHADPSGVGGVIGGSAATLRLKRSIATVAPTDGTVLLLGPTGSGKEVTAHAIHEASGRRGAFVPVNCAAIPAEIAESELFGHKKGAFTGAETERTGYFGLAEGGTLFLDEVGDLPGPVQAKLLRVLEDKTIQPLGGGAPVSVDVRVVAATHIDLEDTGFRQDLLARLCDWVLRIPSLAERRADVLTLFKHFLRTEFPDRPVRDATPEFYEALLLHDWPMNVRELRKLTKRLEQLAGEGPFELIDLPLELRGPLAQRFDKTAPVSAAAAPADPASEDGMPTPEALESALAQAKGNVKAAANDNGWHRTQLYRWLKRAGIDPARFR